MYNEITDIMNCNTFLAMPSIINDNRNSIVVDNSGHQWKGLLLIKPLPIYNKNIYFNEQNICK
jgi:hypothetical protein